MADSTVPDLPTADDAVDPASRLSYEGSGLSDVVEGTSPLETVRRWYAEAVEDERVVEPGAMVVATVDAGGMPNARTVLLKGLDRDGFVFYTGRDSAKGQELAATASAAVVLLWHPMYRQARARGPVEEVPRAVSQAYFQSRPRDSQVAAWASAQSSPLGSRAELEAAVERVKQHFAGHDVLPLPDFWGGYRVRPVEVELWVGRRSRLHDRLVWTSREPGPVPLDAAERWQLGRRQP